MNKLNNKIMICGECDISNEKFNIDDQKKGYGKLIGYYKKTFKNRIMLVGLNSSYRRFPGIYQAFGGEVPHKGTGYEFMKLLKEQNLLNKIYLTNLVKCSVADNKPKKEHFDSCFPHFLNELKLVNPPAIIALGVKPYQYLSENLPMEYRKKLTMVFHPCYWISYKKMTKKQYTQILWLKMESKVKNIALI